MTTAEFIKELERFCVQHGFEIAGTCSNEGIYGEITIRKLTDEPTWLDWDQNKFNFDDR